VSARDPRLAGPPRRSGRAGTMPPTLGDHCQHCQDCQHCQHFRKERATRRRWL